MATFKHSPYVKLGSSAQQHIEANIEAAGGDKKEVLKGGLVHFGEPLKRNGEKAMDAALPFPPRKPAFRKKTGQTISDAQFAPSVTSNNPLQFYGSLQYWAFFGGNTHLSKTGAGAAAPMKHICNMWGKEGLGTIVLGHFALTGPMVTRYPAGVLKAICGEPKKNGFTGAADDLVVAFIDQSGYSQITANDLKVLPGATVALVHFSYVIVPDDIIKSPLLRFSASVGNSKNVHHTVKLHAASGLPLLGPKKIEELFVAYIDLGDEYRAENKLVAAADKLWGKSGLPGDLAQGVKVAIFHHFMLAIQKQVEAATKEGKKLEKVADFNTQSDQIHFQILFSKTDKKEKHVWLHACSDVGASYTQSRFYHITADQAQGKILKKTLLTKYVPQAGTEIKWPTAPESS